MKTLILVIFTLFSFVPGLIAQENEVTQATPFKVYKGNRVVASGVDISYKAGSIKLKTIDGGLLNYQSHEVDKIESPMPRELQYIRSKAFSGQFEAVLSVMKTARGKAFLEEQNFLGWGKRLAAYYAYSLIKEKKILDARPLLRNASAMVAGSDDEYDRQLLKVVEAALAAADGKAGQARGKLNELAKDLDQRVKPYFYNILGDILQSENKKQEAILAYYKTLLLTGKNPYERNYSKMEIAKIYGSTNDPRKNLVIKIR